jgi:hypothetical protein
MRPENPKQRFSFKRFPNPVGVKNDDDSPVHVKKTQPESAQVDI